MKQESMQTQLERLLLQYREDSVVGKAIRSMSVRDLAYVLVINSQSSPAAELVLGWGNT